MVEFPDGVIGEILCRVPVKLLLRYRCVSKHWCKLIDTNFFIKKHLKQSLKAKTNQTLILNRYLHNSVHSVGLYSLTDRSRDIGLPVRDFNNNNNNGPVINIIGSCNGLLCLLVGEKVVVWNPSTRKHVKVVGKTVEKCRFENMDVVYGFGYDSVSDDYRVLMLVHRYGEGESECWRGFESEAYVFSVRSGLWRKARDFPKYPLGEKQARCVLASGVLHFFIIVERERGESGCCLESVLASFDLVTEKCEIINPPEYAKIENSNLMIGEFGGHLFIAHNCFKDGIVHIWVIKDYGVKSWTKLLTLGSKVIKPYEHVIPLACSENGDEVLLMVNFVRLIWYNPKKKVTKVVKGRGLPKRFYPFVSLESLVSLGEKAEDDEKPGEKKKGAKEERVNKFLSVGFKLRL